MTTLYSFSNVTNNFKCVDTLVSTETTTEIVMERVLVNDGLLEPIEVVEKEEKTYSC